MQTPDTTIPRAFGLVLLLAGCGGRAPAPSDEIAVTSVALTTWIGATRYLEIDRFPDTACIGGAPNGSCTGTETAANCPTDCLAKAADANLYVGPDPTDSTASVQSPPCGTPGCVPIFVDWADLPRSRDINDTFTGKDPSAFPGSTSCVNQANNPSKQELTSAGIASNLEYGYLALTRKEANGDSSYFWVITRTSPSLIPGPVSYLDLGGATRTCAVGDQLLTFNLQIGDFLLVGDFEPSSGANVMRVFQVIKARPATDARSATDFAALVTAGVYTELLGNQVRAAINTTNTSTAGFGGATGVFGPGIFAEAAVPMALLSGNSSACGASFYATAISKPSTSATSDMKDLIGPVTASLGVVTPTVTFAATCDNSARYAVTAVGPGGPTLTAMSCAWTFRDGAGAVTANRSDCSGYLTLPAGTATASVVVTDLESGCTNSAGTGNAGPITIAPTRTGDLCEVVACDPATGTVTSSPRPGSYVCRAAAGVCDLAETCNGSSLTCPADVRSTAVCRGSAGVCDPAEVCDGVGVDCPADTLYGTTTTCRAATGPCDVPEVCSGGSALCPGDARVPQGTVCHASTGVCDPAEVCDGTSGACPTDVYASGVVCRAATGECDVAEQCTGASPTCPNDVFVPVDATCADDGNACTTDRCDGAGTCAHLAGHAGAVCRAAAGICDAPELCLGNTATCPHDTYLSGVTCRPAFDLCDVAEACDGTGLACPNDAIAPAGATCRAAAGACDVAEACTGADVVCPGDVLVAGGEICRAAVGDCDVAEVCTGSDAACPADGFSSDGCADDGNPCTVAHCLPGGGCAHDPGNAGAVCRAAAGVCDATETCTGSDAACPLDGYLSGALCRAAAGICDIAEACTGDGVDCPADAPAAAGTECRAVAGECDVAEVCSGAVVTCPPDLKRTDLCRAAAGVCDVAEYCSGDGDTCPGDAFVSGGVCRAAIGPCDVDEACTGSAATCPEDVMAAAGTTCGDVLTDCAGPYCDGTSAACPPYSGWCGDGDVCTIDDVCIEGQCVGTPETGCSGIVFFLVVSDADGNPVGSVRCTSEGDLVRCATLDPAPGDTGPRVLDVRPELMCYGGAP